jgi:hypothetical protein
MPEDQNTRVNGRIIGDSRGTGVSDEARQAIREKMDPESARKIYGAVPPRSEGGTGGNWSGRK